MKWATATLSILALPLLLVGAADTSPKAPSLNPPLSTLTANSPLYHGGTSLVRRSASNCDKVSQCPTVHHADSTCKRHVCGFHCHKGYKAVGKSCAQTCTKASCCKVPANAVAACHSKICSWTCKSGYETCGGKCVLKPGACKIVKDCPKPPKNGHAVCSKKRCSVACNAGFVADGKKCARRPGTCSTVRDCPTAPENGVAVCSGGLCSIQCNAQPIPQGNQCVPVQCTSVSQCTDVPDNGVALSCTANECVYGCNEGYDYVDGQCTPIIVTATGYLRLHEFDFQGTIGYLSSSLNDFGEYGSIVDTRDTTALKVTFSGPSSWTIPGKITLEPPHPSFADLPQFAAVKGFANTNSDVGPGLYNYLYLCPGVLTAPFALPAPRDNAFTRSTTFPEDVESTIFFRNQVGELSAQYIISDGSSVDVYWVLVDNSNALILTGDVAKFKATFSSARQVRVEIQ